MTARTPPMGRHWTGPLRNEQARLAVLHAADDLLAEQGFARTTVEGIARRAGVAKQTVYRWWPGKVEILLDGLLEGIDKHLGIDLDASSADALEQYFRRFAAFVAETDDGQVMLALLGHAQLDQSAGELIRTRLLEPRRVLERALVRRSGAAGTDDEADDLLDARLGAVVLRAMRSTTPPHEASPTAGPSLDRRPAEGDAGEAGSGGSSRLEGVGEQAVAPTAER